ncbi:MAG: LuxR C-terminal-related transcriptional regulator [Bacillota bacterium]|nr:LuxR C-terminal-related transcriptional regulator [Bacillota bacterium]
MRTFHFARTKQPLPEEASSPTDRNLPDKKELRLQWLLLVFAFIWFFCNAYNFDDILFAGHAPAWFFLLLVVSMVLFESLFHRRPQLAVPVTRLMAIGGAVITMLMPLFPAIVFSALYILTAAFMAPLLIMRIHGVLSIAPQKQCFRCYTSAIAVTIILHTFWVILPLPAPVRFTLIAIPGLLASRRLPGYSPVEGQRRSGFKEAVPGRMWLPLVLFTLLINLVSLASAIVNTNYSMPAQQENIVIVWLLARLLPAFGFMIYAWAADHDRARTALILAISFFLAGTWISFVYPSESLWIPLLIADGIGGSFAEYHVLTLPLYLLPYTRRPLFIGSLGFMMNFLSAAIGWPIDVWFPQWLVTENNGIMFFVILFLLCIATMLVIFWQMNLSGEWKESARFQKELALKQAESVETKSTATVDIEQFGLTKREKEIFDLILEGLSAAEMAKCLFITERTVRFHMTNIYQKTQTKSRMELLAKLIPRT